MCTYIKHMVLITPYIVSSIVLYDNHLSTVDCGINIGVRLLIFGFLSMGYVCYQRGLCIFFFQNIRYFYGMGYFNSSFLWNWCKVNPDKIAKSNQLWLRGFISIILNPFLRVFAISAFLKVIHAPKTPIHKRAGVNQVPLKLTSHIAILISLQSGLLMNLKTPICIKEEFAKCWKSWEPGRSIFGTFNQNANLLSKPCPKFVLRIFNIVSFFDRELTKCAVLRICCCCWGWEAKVDFSHTTQ